jgi:hypothetical protein
VRHFRVTTTGQKLLILGLMLGLLSSCIRPVDETTITATPDPLVNVNNGGTSVSITPPTPSNDQSPAGVTAADLPSIEAFILSQGRQVNSGTLNVWQTLSLGSEIIIGFSYTNPSSLPCIGLVIADRVNGVINVYNGESTCATELGAPAIAGNWFLVTNDAPNEIFLTATVGEVFNPTSQVTSGGIVYNDGQAFGVENVQNNHFLAARTDSPAPATRVIFTNEFGNIEAEVVLSP